MRLLRAVLVFMLAAQLTAWADWKNDARRCQSETDADQRIRYCTAAIDSGRLSGADLAAELTNRGNAYDKKGEYDQAIQDYDKAIGLKPSDAKFVANRGRTYLRKGEYDRAIQDCNEAIRLDPSFADAYINRGAAYLDKGEYDRAIQDYDQAIHLNASSALAFYGRAKAYFKKAEHDRAIQDYDQAIRLNPSYVEAFANRGLAYENKDEYDRAIQDYDQAIRLNPSYAGAFYLRANTHYQKKEYELAIKDYDQAIRLSADKGADGIHQKAVAERDITSHRLHPTTAEDFYDRANNEMDDFDQAIRDYDQAIRLNPSYAEAFEARGAVHGFKGEHDLAIPDYDQAIRLNPTYAEAFLGRGDAYSAKGQYDRAIQDYDQAIRLKPKDSLVFMVRGSAYKEKGQYDRAIQDYDQAVQLDPNLFVAFTGRGDAYRRKGQYDRAIQDFDQAIRLNPDYAEAFSNRGFAYFQKDEHDLALKDYEEALRLDPDNADAFHRRGILYANQGDYWSAVSDFDNAIRLDPNDMDAIFFRGLAQFYRGEFAAAQQDLARLKQYPYPALWLYLARSRAGQEARAALAKDAAQMNLREWPGPVINLYLDKTTPLAVLAAARSKDPKKGREQRCEAYFYLGQRALVNGKVDEAQHLFQQTMETQLSSFVEYTGARAELRRLAIDAAKRCDAAKDANAALAACSAAIISGQLSGKALARAYDNRGNWYRSKDEYLRAIQDYDRALQLQPSKSDVSKNVSKTASKPVVPHVDAGDIDIGDDDFLPDSDETEAPRDLFNITEAFTRTYDVFANTFTDRAAVYEAQGDYDRAIQDYGEAIRLVPSFEYAFQRRAEAYVAKGDYERAVQDYDQAIRLPSFFSLRYERGVAHFYLNQFAAAQQDFAEDMKALLPHLYSPIWLYLSQARQGHPARDELAKNTAKLNLKNWPGAVISLYLGAATPESVLAAAKDADLKKAAKQRCEAYFYLGQQALIAGKPDEARRLFQLALVPKLAGFTEYRGAQLELKRLPTAQAMR